MVYFEQRFSRLKVGHSRGAAAPHKPILLLSILQLMHAGEMGENKIYITADLVARFKDNWHLLVKEARFTPNFSLPFYHLKGEKWWHLQTWPGREILLTSSNSIRSFGHLKEVVAYAYFDEPLYLLMQSRAGREALMQTLLQTYFGGTVPPGFGREEGVTTKIIREQILHEDAATYRQHIAAADEEEIFVRGSVFKKEVPRVYNYTCAITGMRLITSREVQLVDACHIVPFAESGNDTITNGICLCPNLHRAFDRHLVAIDADYRVVVSPHISESDGGYALRPLAGKEIMLPREVEYRPAQENLAAHFAVFAGKQL